MPLFFQQDIDEDTRLAIWKIEETERFFLSYVPLQASITHPHKRLQHLAGRYLLWFLFPDFPISLIQIADTRKPYLEDEAYHFSISHCGDFAAAIVSKTKRVGLDIELETAKVERIKHKFITDHETQLQLHPITIWSCKEALFKWYGKGNVDFRKHMELKTVQQNAGTVFTLKALFAKETELLVSLQSRSFGQLHLSFIVT